MTARQLHRASSPWGGGVADLLEALALNVQGLEWQDRALCREIGGDIWFPESRESADPAKKICARCPVAQECFEYSLEIGEEFGIWGGVSEKGRRDIRRREVAA
jgi:WhiB family redox-sensing transcriptional regulator